VSAGASRAERFVSSHGRASSGLYEPVGVSQHGLTE